MTVKAGTGTTSGGSAILSSAKGNSTVTVTGMFCRLMSAESVIEFLNFPLHLCETTNQDSMITTSVSGTVGTIQLTVPVATTQDNEILLGACGTTTGVYYTGRLASPSAHSIFLSLSFLFYSGGR